MPTTISAKKALRQSERKRDHNLFWKGRIKGVTRDLKKLLTANDTDTDILKEKERLLQKYVDKAAKKNVIHKNKANRIKSKYARKITAHEKQTASEDSGKDK